MIQKRGEGKKEELLKNEDVDKQGAALASG